MTETVVLRNYQEEAAHFAVADWEQGYTGTLASMATGTGKTALGMGVIVSELRAGKMGRTLFVVGTKKLVKQTASVIDNAWPQFFGMVGVVQAENNDVTARFIIATWQSLTVQRLNDILAFGAITHLVIDEAHHSVCDGISRVVDRLKQAYAGLRVFGITATPQRTDKIGLSKIFQHVCYKYPINKAIKDKWLTPFTALGVSLDVDISNIRENENGWNDDQMGDILSAENIKEIVLTNWKQYMSDRKTIGFVASIRQAERFAEYFNDHGIPAAMVCGKTPPDEIDRRIADLEAGRIKTLFNVYILTEGIDLPFVDGIMMVAPTKSDLIYVQRLGRGLRLYPNKADCVVLDFAPVGGRNIVMAGDVLGLPREVKKAQEKAEKQDVLFSFKFDELGEAKTIDPAELIVHVLDLLGSHFLAWTADNRGACAAIGDKETGRVDEQGNPVKVSVSMLIEFPDNPAQAAERIKRAEEVRARGEWRAEYDDAYHQLCYKLWLVEGGKAERVGYFPSIDAAKDQGDKLAEENYNAILGDKKREWRKEPATPKQVALLSRMKEEIPANLRKGQAAQLITKAFAWKAVKQAKYRQAEVYT